MFKLSERIINSLFFSDEIIGHRNQDNGFPDRFVEVESRDGGNDEVTTGKLAISYDIDAHEIGFFHPSKFITNKKIVSCDFRWMRKHTR